MYLEEIQVLSFCLSDFIGWQLRCYVRVHRRCLKFSKKLTLTLNGGHWWHNGAAQFRPGHRELGLRPLSQGLCLLSPKGNMGEGGLPDLFPVLQLANVIMLKLPDGEMEFHWSILLFVYVCVKFFHNERFLKIYFFGACKASIPAKFGAGQKGKGGIPWLSTVS